MSHLHIVVSTTRVALLIPRGPCGMLAWHHTSEEVYTSKIYLRDLQTKIKASAHKALYPPISSANQIFMTVHIVHDIALKETSHFLGSIELNKTATRHAL